MLVSSQTRTKTKATQHKCVAFFMTSLRSWLLPLDDMEPWHAAIPLDRIWIAAARRRFHEIAQQQPGFQTGLHVRLQRAVPVANPYALPLRPNRTLFEIAIDRVRRGTAGSTPAFWHTCGAKAREVRHEQRTAWSKRAHHVRNGIVEIVDVYKRQVTHNKVERALTGIECFSFFDSIVAARIERSCTLHQRNRRIDPDRSDAFRPHHPAKSALT